MVRMGMESKFHFKKILGLLAILPLLASISIVNNFGEAFAKSEQDFNQCIGFLSVDEVKTTIGYSGELEVLNSDISLKALEDNPNLQTQCTITFKPTSIQSAIALMVSEFNSTEAADERFSKSLEYFLGGGFTGIKGEFDDWKTFEVNSTKKLVKNLLAAQYQTYVISLSTPLTDEVIVADDLKYLSTIVLEKLGMNADTITKDREKLKIEVEDYLIELKEEEALDKSESASDLISEGDPLTEAPIHEEKTKDVSEGDPLTEAPIHEEKTMSPYYQLKIGTAAKDINCNEGLELILNPLNGSPNCVKPYTASVLIKRGWTTT